MSRKVDFLHNPDDLEAATLASFGLYSRSVAKRVGMTANKAQYRIHKSGGSAERRAWREGTSDTFRTVLKVVQADVRDEVKQRIAKEELQRQREKESRRAKKKK